jgi:virginiamycin A acetyltransferase
MGHAISDDLHQKINLKKGLILSTTASLFTPEELDDFHSLADENAVLEGHIRGPRPKWSISGQALCGKYTSINGVFNARGTVRIGKYCAFGQHISLISRNHRTDLPNQQVWLNKRFGFTPLIESKGPVEIGHNVWIGDKANVLSGVQVGHGAVIAAGATVTRSVPPFCIAGGTPAQEIRRRFSETVIAQLLELRWWEWSDERIAKNKTFFERSISPEEEIDLMSLIVD